jgi:hypothetical protein
MGTFATAEERDQLRSGIARTHAEARETIESNYVQARGDLEDQYHKDLADNEQALREAYVAAGLNPDGTDPLGRPQGSAV